MNLVHPRHNISNGYSRFRPAGTGNAARFARALGNELCRSLRSGNRRDELTL
jgi:hypothetical protein